VLFVYVRSNGSVVQCDAACLIDYMLSEGDFLDPETRLEFSPEAMAQLDVFCIRLGKPLVSEAKRDRTRFVEQDFVQDALIGLERLAGAKIADILDAVDQGLCLLFCFIVRSSILFFLRSPIEPCSTVNDRKIYPDNAQSLILNECLPEFQSFFIQIVVTDRKFAHCCAAQYISFLKGPPNRPTRDETGLLSQVLHLVQTTCDDCF